MIYTGIAQITITMSCIVIIKAGLVFSGINLATENPSLKFEVRFSASFAQMEMLGIWDSFFLPSFRI